MQPLYIKPYLEPHSNYWYSILSDQLYWYWGKSACHWQHADYSSSIYSLRGNYGKKIKKKSTWKRYMVPGQGMWEIKAKKRFSPPMSIDSPYLSGSPQVAGPNRTGLLKAERGPLTEHSPPIVYLARPNSGLWWLPH